MKSLTYQLLFGISLMIIGAMVFLIDAGFVAYGLMITGFVLAVWAVVDIYKMMR